MTVFLFCSTLVLWMLSSQAQGTGERGPFAFRASRFLKISGTAAIVAVIGLVVWGFSALDWYVVVGTMVVGAIAQYLINESNLSHFYKAAPFLDVFVILSTTFLWAWHWPF
jgi:hypothetical protein